MSKVDYVPLPAGFIKHLIEHGWAELPDNVRRVAWLLDWVSTLVRMGANYLIPWRDIFEWEEQTKRVNNKKDDPDLGLLWRAGGKKKAPTKEEIEQGRMTFDRKKWIAQYTALLPARLRLRGVPAEEIQRWSHLFQLWQEGLSWDTLVGLSIARKLDKQLPGYNLFDRFRAGEWRHKSRCIIYLPPAQGEPALFGKDDAQAHSDLGGLTKHNLSSKQGKRGLWVLDQKTNRWIKVDETTADRSLVFFGDKIHRVTGGNLRKLIHAAKDPRAEANPQPPSEGERRKEAKERRVQVTFLHPEE